jgi:magnesium transporter
MHESAKHISKKAGLPPGSLIHVGKRKADKMKISVIDYTKTDYAQTIYKTAEECFPYKTKNSVSWVNIDGLHDTEAIASIGTNFGLHPLLIEDVLNTKHRPKLEEYDDHIFLTLKMLGIGKDKVSIISEQISFVMGAGWILSFQEKEGDLFDGLRLRLQENKGNMREKGVDYLLYRLLDTVIEHISEITENLEERVINSPTSESLNEIHEIKKLLFKIRKATYPLREAVSNLQKNTNNLIQDNTTHYLRDVYEHIIQINDTVETQRDMIASIMELYLTGVSNRTNQVMQLLTIISTIFIPLTFIAGIYGMNFDNIPELHWKYGYVATWIVMIVIVIIMLRYFKRKRWL